MLVSKVAGILIGLALCGHALKIGAENSNEEMTLTDSGIELKDSSSIFTNLHALAKFRFEMNCNPTREDKHECIEWIDLDGEKDPNHPERIVSYTFSQINYYNVTSTKVPVVYFY